MSNIGTILINIVRIIYNALTFTCTLLKTSTFIRVHVIITVNINSYHIK